MKRRIARVALLASGALTGCGLIYGIDQPVGLLSDAPTEAGLSPDTGAKDASLGGSEDGADGSDAAEDQSGGDASAEGEPEVREALAFVSEQFVEEQYVAVNDVPALMHPASLTLEAWMRILSVPPQEVAQPVVMKPYGSGPDDSFGIWEDGAVFAGINLVSSQGSTTLRGPITVGDLGWHHLALTFDAETAFETLYLDGKVADSKNTVDAGSDAPIYDTQSLLIGADSDAKVLNGSFSGEISEVRFYGVARTVTEVAQDMAGCSPEGAASLIAYYPLNDGSGNIAHDSTGHHLDGTLTGNGATVPQWIKGDSPPGLTLAGHACD